MAKGNKNTRQIKDAIRAEYVEGTIGDNNVRVLPSMRELAEKYGVTANTISRWSRDDGWLQARETFQAEYARKTTVKKADRMAEQASKFDQNCLAIADGMIREVGRRLQENIEALRGNTEAQMLDTGDLKDLAIVAIHGQKLGRLALGEASEITKGTLDVDGNDNFRRTMRQLLELREQRAESHSRVH